MLLESEREQNARIDAPGRQYVLKIVNAAEDLGVIEMQNAVLDHLEAVGVSGYLRHASELVRLLLDVEFVSDRETLEPATARASAAINHMRKNRVLPSTNGPHDNVLKVKPPMVFSRTKTDRLCRAVEEALDA